MPPTTGGIRRCGRRVAAVERAQHFCSKNTHYLKLDIAQYFNSIDQQLLKIQLESAFKETPLLKLFFAIIDSFNCELGKGLPIGTLTSQYFANAYLNPLDRFIKETLRVKSYVRYMDDFVLWHDSRQQLERWNEAIAIFLQEKLALKLHVKQKLISCRQGLPFLGFRLSSSSRWLARRGRKHYKQRIDVYEQACQTGHLSSRELQRRLDALNAATELADTLNWRNPFWKQRKVCEF